MHIFFTQVRHPALTNMYPEQGPLEDDDLPVGEVLSRRRALGLFGLAGGSLLGGSVRMPGRRPIRSED